MEKEINSTSAHKITAGDIAAYSRIKRRKEGLTLDDMSEILSCSKFRVYCLENAEAQNMKEETVDKILGKLGVNREEFLQELQIFKSNHSLFMEQELEEREKIRQFLEYRSELPEETQDSVADIIGCSRVYVTLIINKKRELKSKRTKCKILAAFKISASELNYLNELDAIKSQEITDLEKEKIKRKSPSP